MFRSMLYPACSWIGACPIISRCVRFLSRNSRYPSYAAVDPNRQDQVLKLTVTEQLSSSVTRKRASTVQPQRRNQISSARHRFRGRLREMSAGLLHIAESRQPRL